MKCLCATTRRIARLLTQRYEEALRPANLTPAQFELMSTLAHEPNTTQAKLAECLALDQTTLSRNLNVLIFRTWITRTPNARDRRQLTYALTSRGKEALSQAMPLWRSVHDRMYQELGSSWTTTWSTLDRLNQVTNS